MSNNHTTYMDGVGSVAIPEDGITVFSEPSSLEYLDGVGAISNGTAGNAHVPIKYMDGIGSVATAGGAPPLLPTVKSRVRVSSSQKPKSSAPSDAPTSAASSVSSAHPVHPPDSLVQDPTSNIPSNHAIAIPVSQQPSPYQMARQQAQTRASSSSSASANQPIPPATMPTTPTTPDLMTQQRIISSSIIPVATAPSVTNPSVSVSANAHRKPSSTFAVHSTRPTATVSRPTSHSGLVAASAPVTPPDNDASLYLDGRETVYDLSGSSVTDPSAASDLTSDPDVVVSHPSSMITLIQSSSSMATHPLFNPLVVPTSSKVPPTSTSSAKVDYKSNSSNTAASPPRRMNGPSSSASTAATAATAVATKVLPTLSELKLPAKLDTDFLTTFIAMFGTPPTDLNWPNLFAKFVDLDRKHSIVLAGHVLAPFMRVTISGFQPIVSKDPEHPGAASIAILQFFVDQMDRIELNGTELSVHFRFSKTFKLTPPQVRQWVLHSTRASDPYAVCDENLPKRGLSPVVTFVLKPIIHFHMNKSGLVSVTKGDIRIKKYPLPKAVPAKGHTEYLDPSGKPRVQVDFSSKKPLLAVDATGTNPLMRDGHYVPRSSQLWLVLSIVGFDSYISLPDIGLSRLAPSKANATASAPEKLPVPSKPIAPPSSSIFNIFSRTRKTPKTNVLHATRSAGPNTHNGNEQ